MGKLKKIQEFDQISIFYFAPEFFAKNKKIIKCKKTIVFVANHSFDTLPTTYSNKKAQGI